MMPLASNSRKQKKDKPWAVLIVVISILIPVVVSLLLFNPEKLQAGGWVKWLPHLNGIINTATSVALLAGFLFIKNNKPEHHRLSMLSSFALGTLFLVSYLIYHSSVPSTSYENPGAIRYLYYFLLLSHILLAVAVVPLVLLALYHAIMKNFVRHKKVARYAFPVWLYVSVSGVIVYLMISPYYQ
jgi:putative membrane protein